MIFHLKTVPYARVWRGGFTLIILDCCSAAFGSLPDPLIEITERLRDNEQSADRVFAIEGTPCLPSRGVAQQRSIAEKAWDFEAVNSRYEEYLAFREVAPY